MSDLAESIAEKVVEAADKEDIIFARSSKVDNMLQLVFEQRVSVQDIDDVVEEIAPKEHRKKYLILFANDLTRYLSAKLTKSRLSGFRGAPKKPEEKEKKKSKSELFLEQREKKAREKELKNKKGEGTVEKISLKEVGQAMEEEMEHAKQLEEKRKTEQESVEQEQQKHVTAYQTAFELFAHAVEISVKDDTTEVRELIKNIGSQNITSRQVACEKMARHPHGKYAVDALVAALKDKNIIVPVITVMQNIAHKKSLLPLIGMVKEYPTSNDLLFRGPTIKAIGAVVKAMNEKEKGSGLKYLYQVFSNPKFEANLRVLVRIVTKDLSNAKAREDYYAPICFKWLNTLSEKIIEVKKKKVKVGFVNMAVQTDLTKELKEFCATLKKISA